MKIDSIKEYKRRIELVKDYICSHYDSELTIDELSRIACFSQFHFNRIFTFVTGESPGSYQKRLRLEKAMYLIKYNLNRKITEIALEVGFGSSAAFNRIFKKHFNCTPNQIRANIQVKKNDESIAPLKIRRPECCRYVNIYTIEPFKTFCKEYIGLYGEKNVKSVWCEHINEARKRNLITEGTSFVGIVYDDPQISHQRCRYDCCICTSIPVNEKMRTIEGGRYAVFSFSGNSEHVFKAYEWIYGTWFPESGYEPGISPGYENYFDIFSKPRKSNLIEYEICIPVEKIRYY